MNSIIQRIRAWRSSTRIVLEDGDAAIVMKSNGEEHLFMPTLPEDKVEVDLKAPTFKLMLFCWIHADEQEHIRDEFIRFLEKDEDDDEEEGES